MKYTRCVQRLLKNYDREVPVMWHGRSYIWLTRLQWCINQETTQYRWHWLDDVRRLGLRRWFVLIEVHFHCMVTHTSMYTCHGQWLYLLVLSWLENVYLYESAPNSPTLYTCVRLELMVGHKPAGLLSGVWRLLCLGSIPIGQLLSSVAAY
jgi:hypothetical protein